VTAHDLPHAPQTTDDALFQSQLVEMPRPECLRKLALARTGRVAFDMPDGPVVLPVNVRVHGIDIFLRTAAGSELAEALHDRPASFQIDQLDEYRQTGWSVLVQGTANWVTEAELPRYPSERPVPWAGGERSLNIRIRANRVSGRILVG
jgi:hypothetical protein